VGEAAGALGTADDEDAVLDAVLNRELALVEQCLLDAARRFLIGFIAVRRHRSAHDEQLCVGHGSFARGSGRPQDVDSFVCSPGALRRSPADMSLLDVNRDMVPLLNWGYFSLGRAVSRSHAAGTEGAVRMRGE